MSPRRFAHSVCPPTAAVLLFFLSPVVDAHGCAGAPVKALFLAETAATQSAGEHQLGAQASHGSDGDGADGAYEFGVSHRVQLATEWEYRRAENEASRVAGASVGVLLFCEPGQPLLRFDAGIERDIEEHAFGASTSLALGQTGEFGGWFLNASHSRVENETAYAAAVLFETGVRPISIEASHARSRTSRANWVSAGIYLFSTERFELGVAFADGSADASGKWEALLSVVGEF